jgi:hypothetical protein
MDASQQGNFWITHLACGLETGIQNFIIHTSTDKVSREAKMLHKILLT